MGEAKSAGAERVAPDAQVVFGSLGRRGFDVGSQRPLTVPLRDLAALDLDGVRAYRRTLSAEEDRISYWRRLIHARIDVLLAQNRSGTTLSFDELVRALGDTGTGRSRQALVRVRAAEPLPELPDLQQMWLVDVDPRDDVQVAEALDRLRVAETQLVDYRRALHARIEEATNHLIDRYRRDPRVALALLPHG